MASGKTAEDSVLLKEDLSRYFISHNLSIARQCLRSILAVLPDDSGEGDRASGPNNEDTSETIYSVSDHSHNSSNDLIKRILVLVEDFETSLSGSGLPKNTEPFSSKRNETDFHDNFRRGLVDLMVLTLQCWEQTTGMDKIRLAEESNLWRVTNDNSQLRVRTMERYFSLKKLPKVPRWQTVLDTAYFVLNRADSESRTVQQLESAVSHMVSELRSRALI